MPLTGACFAAGALALAGVFPTAGFFSKDEVLAAVLAGGHPLGFAILVVTAGMTAFYIGRAFFVTMMGSNHAAGHPHDPPAAMRVPLIVLASLSVIAGLAAPLIPRFFAASSLTRPRRPSTLLFVPLLGMVAALAPPRDRVRRLPEARSIRKGSKRLASARHRARAALVRRRRFRGDLPLRLHEGSSAVGWVDRYLVDGSSTGHVGAWIGASRLSAIQSGRAQTRRATAFGLVLLMWLAWAR
jgi:NADH-quinone oxidoreductase subunit L